MEHVASGIQALSRAILDDTKVEAEQIVVDARKAADSTLQRARDEAEHTHHEIVEQARREAFHEEQRTLATARLEAQRVMLNRREQLIDRVFDRAEAMLATVHDSDQYSVILQKLISDGIAKLGEPTEVIVRVSEQDVPILSKIDLDELAAEWKGNVHLSIGDPVEIVGGVVIDTVDGHKRYDNSFEARLSLERERLRAQVYQILHGEA